MDLEIGKVSVVLISYNGDKFIKKQILSILDQLRVKDELIISDDGSSDGTLSIVNSINDNRLKVFKGPALGINKNVENGINHCMGDFVMLSDQDDVWLPGRLKYFIHNFKENDFIFCDAQVVTENGDVLIDSYFNFHRASRSLLGNIFKCRTLGCCIGFKKSALENPFEFNFHYSYLPFDYFLTIYGLTYFKCNFSDQVLHSYRRHTSNVSKGGNESDNSIFKKITYRFRVLKHTIKARPSKKKPTVRLFNV